MVLLIVWGLANAVIINPIDKILSNYKAIQDEISNNSLPTKKSMLKQISDIIGV